MCVKDVLASYSPTAATPAIEPMVIPAIAPGESPAGGLPTVPAGGGVVIVSVA